MVDAILFNQVSYEYNKGTPFSRRALYDINLGIPANQVTAIIGHTGSGKSTLLQHLNVLVRPTEGSVIIDNQVVTATSKHQSLKSLRKKVGVVFQFPEAQLFEETVIKDVMFGPINFGASEDEARIIAERVLQQVGISNELFERSPSYLSGGQMRRVAIAGVLALEPEILVLDEPTAGLDPAGQEEMMRLFMALHREHGLTLVMVTHQMEDVARYAQNVVVMSEGQVVKVGTPDEIFESAEWLETYHLNLPNSVDFWNELHDKTGFDNKKFTIPLTTETLISNLVSLLEKAGE